MTIAQLRYFHEVCKCGSTTKAAQELFVSQPTVSSSIFALEKELSIKLFSRETKRLCLTAEGKIIHARVEEILNSIDGLVHLAQKMCAPPTITLCASPVVGIICYSFIFQKFSKLFPQIRLSIVEHGSLEAMKLLSEEKVDLAVLLLNDSITDEFEVLPLGSTSIVYTVNNRHPLAGAPSIDLASIKDERFILMNADAYQTGALILDRFRQIGASPSNYLTLNQLYLIKKVILGGMDGAFLLRNFLEDEKNLIGIPLDPPIKVDIGLIWKKNAELRDEVLKFIAFVKKCGLLE